MQQGGIMMSEYYGGHAIKIEAGQILYSVSFPAPNELVCIQVPKVFDQVALRECITRNVVLSPSLGICRPTFSFEGIKNFDIKEVKVISKTDSQAKPGINNLKLIVKVSYDIIFTDGISKLKQPDEAFFNLTVNGIYCPNCLAQTALSRYAKDNLGTSVNKNAKNDVDIKVEGLFESLGETICPCTGALIFDIGAFFVIKCECTVQLLMPAYGYCPIPVEQSNPLEQNCVSFNDKTKNPFPTQFFPDQKRNILDNAL